MSTTSTDTRTGTIRAIFYEKGFFFAHLANGWGLSRTLDTALK